MDKMFLQCSLVETRIRICSVVVMIREIQGHLVCMTHIVCIFNWQHPMLNSYCESMSAPGKHFVIMNPGTVKSFMGQNSSIPQLNTTQSIRSVKTNVSQLKQHQTCMHSWWGTQHYISLTFRLPKYHVVATCVTLSWCMKMASQQTSVHVTPLLKEMQKFVWFWT